jgi:hypothetical protein
MLKLIQLQSSTSAAAIPRHSNATSPAVSFVEPYEFFFSFNGSSPIKKFLLIQTLAPGHELYIGYPSPFSAKLLTTPLPFQAQLSRHSGRSALNPSFNQLFCRFL